MYAQNGEARRRAGGGMWRGGSGDLGLRDEKVELLEGRMTLVGEDGLM